MVCVACVEQCCIEIGLWIVSHWSSTGPGRCRHVSRVATRSDVRMLKEGLSRRPTRLLSLPVPFTDHIIVVP